MRNVMFFIGLALILALMAGCSNMDKITQPAPPTEDGITTKQGDREVDSLLVNVYAVFSVNIASGPSPISYTWSFGDSSVVYTTFNQTEHKYINTGLKHVSVVLRFTNGPDQTYVKDVKVYQMIQPPVDDILVRISSHQETSGMWTYQLGLLKAAYSGSGLNPFIIGTAGVIVTTPYNTEFNWVQLVPAGNGDRLLITVSCINQNDVFLNFGGGFNPSLPSAAWYWANIQQSSFYVPEANGGNLHFSLVNGQLLTVGGNQTGLPGLLGDPDPSTIRMTVAPDSLRVHCNLAMISNFQGPAWLEYKTANGDYDRKLLNLSPSFSGWADAVLPLSVLDVSPVTIRYGQYTSDYADMAGSRYWVPDEASLQFYLESVPAKSNNGDWQISPVVVGT